MSAKSWAWLVAGVVIAVHCLPQELRSQGIFLENAPDRGEPFRWLFAHFIHRSWAHLGLNLVTWALACWVLRPVLDRDPQWGWQLGAIAIGISASLACLEATALPFVGLSALVYAWLVAGAMKGLVLRPCWGVYATLLALLLAKVVLESALGRSLGGAQLGDLGPGAAAAHHHALGWGLVWGGIGVAQTWRTSSQLRRGFSSA